MNLGFQTKLAFYDQNKSLFRNAGTGSKQNAPALWLGIKLWIFI
jgi:hypothetical protein